MYAVVASGGKQHRVREGEVLRVEKLDGTVGSKVTLDRVLMLGGDTPTVGAPYIRGAKVTAEIVRQARAKKVLVFRKRRRKGFKKLQGHRQPYTHLKITAIEKAGS